MAVGSASTIIGISCQPSLQELCSSVNATHQPLLTAQHRLWEWAIFPSTSTIHGGHCEVTVVMITSRWTVINIVRPWEQNQEVQTNSCERHLRLRTKGEKGWDGISSLDSLRMANLRNHPHYHYTKHIRRLILQKCSNNRVENSIWRWIM